MGITYSRFKLKAVFILKVRAQGCKVKVFIAVWA
jgi:hypothetical protein